MIQSKSKSELGFHFHFVSFHFTSFRFTSAHLIFISYYSFHFHFDFYFIFTFLFHLVSYVVSFCFVSSRGMQRTLQWLYTRRALGFIGIKFLFQLFCKPTAEAMRKQFGSFAEAGTLISQSDRPAGEFLRLRQISPEAKSLRIRIMRKACGRRSGRFGIMFEFPAEAKRLENRISRKPIGSFAEEIWIYFDFHRGSKAADE